MDDLAHDPGARGLEQLLAELATTFINLAPEAIDGRIEQAIGLVAEFGGADRVTVGQLSRDGKRLERTHQWARSGFPRIEGDEPPASYPPYPWASQVIFGRREPVVLASLDALPPEAAQDRQSFERLGVKSVATFPLLVGDRVIGVLSLATLARARTWTAELLDRLALLSQIVASALGRARTAAELQRTLGFEQLLADLSASFVNLAPEGVDGQIVEALGQVALVLDLDRSHVAQRGLEDGRFHVTHQWVRDGFPRAPHVVPGETLPWLVQQISGGDAVVLSTADDLPPEATGEREFIRQHGPRSSAVLPLLVGGAVIGAVAFGCFRDERRWSTQTLARLRVVAQILASALDRKRADLALRAALADNERLRQRLEAENSYLQGEVKSSRALDQLVGQSPALRAVLHKVAQVAATDVPVLLLGETGTGKELLAHAVHAQSPRHARPLITVNCAALPATLIESELFGHEKGAFTGAIRAQPGRFELAHGSTLFLDEIGDLDPALQAKLLRALQGGEIQRLGSPHPVKVDVRVIAATNRDLDAALDEGRFRPDLYYRLSVFPVEVPPLRERRADIPLLAWHFIQARQRALGRTITAIPRPLMEALVAYDWPGNVRELQNVVERALLLSPGPTLQLDEALGRPRRARGPRAPGETLADAERAHIESVLDRCAWRIEGRGQAAERLGLQPSTLRHRMRKLGLKRPASR